jgi:hypothetical protein
MRRPGSLAMQSFMDFRARLHAGPIALLREHCLAYDRCRLVLLVFGGMVERCLVTFIH